MKAFLETPGGKAVVIVVCVVALGLVIWQGMAASGVGEGRRQQQAMDVNAEIDRLTAAAKGDINTLSPADRQRLIEIVGEERRAIEVVQQRGGTLPAHAPNKTGGP